MITMEFDEMKKIWDSQNNEPMYAINEAALHKSIQTKKTQAGRLTNINDIGLIIIAVATGALLLAIGKQSLYDYLAALALLLIAVYVWVGRIRRKKQETRFDRSILGELDQAIASVDYEARRAKTFVWWFLLPVAIPVLFNLLQAGIPLWKWFVIPAAFVLSFVLVQWELKQKFIPRKQKLETLRDKLKEDKE